MIELQDQMNYTIRLEKFPERIVSLVPSQTELLDYLGLENEVVGITKFCIHPDDWFKSKTRVGGTKNIHHEIIDELKPDLIIGNKEENSPEDILALKEKYPVYMSDIFTVEDALQMIGDIGNLTNKEKITNSLIRQIQSSFTNFPSIQKKVLYLIWADPFMAAGKKTFIGDIIKKLGMQNVLLDNECRYQSLSNEEIAALNADLIILSSEPFPFKKAHSIELNQLTNAKIIFADGEMFSWYGSRMLEMQQYFDGLIKQLKSFSP